MALATARKSFTVSEFINTKYREFWNYSNANGKNAIVPKEQLPEVVRKIIYSSFRLNIRENKETKTAELAGETSKFHAHATDGIEDSIKGVATSYKTQTATRLLEGIGNFGYAPGDSGAAARYTSVAGSPLLSAIYQDLLFVPMSSEDTGIEQPEYISSPLPFSLIVGSSAIGTGKSCYVAEREASHIINWIDKLRNKDWKGVKPPEPMSITGCDTAFNEANGYIYYTSKVLYGVDMHDFSKKGKFDVIVALPPGATAGSVKLKLETKLPPRAANKIFDGSGAKNKTAVIIPTGYLDEEDYAKYGMVVARKEQIYMWDEEFNTMRGTTLNYIAKHWFEDRCRVVQMRLEKNIADLEKNIHKIDLIKAFADNKMIEWSSSKVEDFFVKLNPESGKEDTSLVLSQSARTFLPENLGVNEITRDKNESQIADLHLSIARIGDFVIDEARDIIKKQEEFFAGRE